MRRYTQSLLFSLLIVAISIGSSSAQDYSVGLKVGVSSTTFSGTSDTPLSWRSALAGGFVFGASFGDFVKIQPEMIYTVKGATAENVTILGEPTNLDAIFSIAYIDLPLLLHLYPVQRRNIYPKIFAGPMYSYQLEASVETIEPGGNSQTESDESVDGSDYGFVVGAGIDFDYRGERVTFDARYLFGQSNIRSSRPDAPLHNRGLLFLLGVAF